MRKLYENFHIFNFQKKKKVSAETIPGNTVLLFWHVMTNNCPKVDCFEPGMLLAEPCFESFPPI